MLMRWADGVQHCNVPPCRTSVWQMTDRSLLLIPPGAPLRRGGVNAQGRWAGGQPPMTSHLSLRPVRTCEGGSL